MNKKYSAQNSNNTSIDVSVTSRLHRLRIQEVLLLQSASKSGTNTRENDVGLSGPSGYQDLQKKFKNSYIHLKNLYDEIKANTQSQELFVDLDIDEMKKKIFELENSIKIFKSDISSELAILKQNELDLNKKVIENPNEVENVKRRPKTQSVHFNTIVPSPVKVLMTSPFKCLEVQQFQEFMKNSPNRHGGWNEYNYNLFVKYWQKFFGKTYISEFEDETFQQSKTFIMFMEDVLSKLQDISANLFASFVKWYINYLCLKDKQQKAIDKWKWNKTTARKVLKKELCADEDDNFPLETIMDTHSFIASNLITNQSNLREMENKKKIECIDMKRKIDRSHKPHNIFTPTKQWLNRYNSYNKNAGAGSSPGCHSVENMKKQLRTPYWRLGL